ncbi:hypothetical protein LVD13_07620 [Flavobacteriaceae bacterium D16]|nr:hypothetical protein [Flavobacteriaceae bacterium D16]
MKKLYQNTVFLLALLFLIPALGRNDYPQAEELEIHILSKKKWVGVWEYTVSDVPPEYTNGELHVTKSGREYQVELVLEYGKIPAQSVVLKSKTLYFEVDIDGMQIEITLNRVDDTVSGEVSSPDGVFFLEGERKE